jgi:hypothetical protein
MEYLLPRECQCDERNRAVCQDGEQREAFMMMIDAGGQREHEETDKDHHPNDGGKPFAREFGLAQERARLARDLVGRLMGR